MLAGKNATPEKIAAIRVQLGLDKPIYVQYGKFWSADCCTATSASRTTCSRPVTEMIRENAPNTIQLALAAVLIELLGIPLGHLLGPAPVHVLGHGARPRRRSSSGASRCSCSASSCSGSSASSSNLLPLIGAGDNVLWVIPATWDSFATLILPAVTLGLIEVAYISYMQRASMLEVIRSDYIRTARAKGLSERRVVTKHAFKNAVIPVMTIAGIDLGALMGGAILTETVFSRPGIGLMIYQAIGARDLPVVAGGVLFATVVYVFANLFVDLGYACVDPRIRLEE